MSIELKPLDEQVIVITGASSGIGAATAETAARRGAKVVMAARSAETLHRLAQEFTSLGGDVIAVTCDVSKREDVAQLAAAAIDRYGRIDTWVNNAAQGLYGRLDEHCLDDSHTLFEINFWGTVYGSLIALPYLKQHGGALINIGSEVSEAATPLLGMYVASKHAVKGFTDSLRIEVEELDQAPVSVTLIQPTAVDTNFPNVARNFMDKEASLPEPLLDPEDVAEAILDAAETPTRDKKVGVRASINALAAKLMPGFADHSAAKQAEQLQGDNPPRDADGALEKPSEDVARATT